MVAQMDADKITNSPKYICTVCLVNGNNINKDGSVCKMRETDILNCCNKGDVDGL